MENQSVVVNRVAGKVILSVLSGALMGALAVYLYAPRSGMETRDQWKERMRRGKDRVGSLPGALKDASGAAKSAFLKSSEEHMPH
jgi:gas vesicle protein